MGMGGTVGGGGKKGPSGGAKYEKNISKLAERISISRQNLYKWMSREGFPAETRRGWDVGAVQAWIGAERERLIGTDAPAALRVRKLVLACKLDEAKLAHLHGSVIPVDTVRQMFVEYADMVNQVLELFVSETAAMVKKPELLEVARTLRDRARHRLAGKLKELAEKSAEVKGEGVPPVG